MPKGVYPRRDRQTGRRYETSEFPNTNPLIRCAIDLINETGLRYYEVCEKAGVNHSFISHFTTSEPGLIKFDSILRSIGYRLKIEHIEQQENAEQKKKTDDEICRYVKSLIKEHYGINESEFLERGRKGCTSVYKVILALILRHEFIINWSVVSKHAKSSKSTLEKSVNKMKSNLEHDYTLANTILDIIEKANEWINS